MSRDREPPARRARTAADLPRALRPREKLLDRGPRSLTMVELVSLVIGGSSGDTRNTLAERLVRRHGLSGMASLKPQDWSLHDGVGPISAARLCAAFELGRRAHVASGVEERPKINRPRAAFEQVRNLGRAKKEHLVGLYLDSQNGLVRRETISIGSLNTTRTHPREILFPAVIHLALGFILAHNHPSGALEPSEEDVEFTRAVHRAGQMMGIELYDHLIVAGGRYISLRERGIV
jgi:DNA repair protein RadC